MTQVLDKVEDLIMESQDTLLKLQDIEQTLNEGKELDQTQKGFLRSKGIEV